MKAKPLIKLSKLPLSIRHILNGLVVASSLLLCLLLLPLQLPGMVLLGTSPNWLLIWLVAWSLKRKPLNAAIAGLALGWIQDGMSAPHPSHAVSLMIVGFVTARIQKQRFIQEDFISVALIVFGMTVLAESVTAIQYILDSSIINAHSFASRTVSEIWTDYQRVTLASAIVSSLWAPVLYYPLNRWWQQIKVLEQA